MLSKGRRLFRAAFGILTQACQFIVYLVQKPQATPGLALFEEIKVRLEIGIGAGQPNDLANQSMARPPQEIIAHVLPTPRRVRIGFKTRASALEDFE